MPAKIPAKVDYIKPLEGKPYREVVREKKEYKETLKRSLAEIVGAENVRDEQELLKKYSCDRSLETHAKPAFVVFPHAAEEVSRLVKLANEGLLPVIPASSGSHSYGCTIPRMGGIVVDLSGWKKILKIDHRNRAARIEPGVTYDELSEALNKEGLRPLMPLLPRKDQSVLTAHLEAHPMLIPEFNYSEPLYTAEIVMPGGEIFRTGSAASGSPETIHTDMVGPWGPGFDWNRLYTRSQGALGIVTWANIMAEPLPTKQKIYLTPGRTIADLITFTYNLQRRWLGYECFILNKVNMALILGEKMPDDYAALKQKLPEFIQVFCIAGLKRFPDERIAYQEADFFAAAQEAGVQPQLSVPEVPQAARFFASHLNRCWDKDVYWKDAYKGASADIFFITTMDRAAQCIAEMQQVAITHDYPATDLGVYLQPIENGRVAHLEFNIFYSPADARECSRIKKLHTAASERMYALGAVFTRAYGKWAEMVNSRNAVQNQTAKMIKETLDPKNIMNPGKIGF
jgi:FAD/FMN-containing dehydrogenase